MRRVCQNVAAAYRPPHRLARLVFSHYRGQPQAPVPSRVPPRCHPAGCCRARWVPGADAGRRGPLGDCPTLLCPEPTKHSSEQGAGDGGAAAVAVSSTHPPTAGTWVCAGDGVLGHPGAAGSAGAGALPTEGGGTPGKLEQGAMFDVLLFKRLIIFRRRRIG